MKKHLPLIIGLFLGVVSVIISKVPIAVAAWSGMKVVGNHLGYLLGALVVSYINAWNLKKSIIASGLTMVIASVVYYSLIVLMRLFDIGFTESFENIAVDFLKWCVIGIAVSVVSSIAMRIAVTNRNILLRYGALIATYISLLAIIVFIDVRRIVNLRNDPQVVERGYLTGYFGRDNFYNDIYLLGFSFVLITILFVVAIFIEKKRNLPDYKKL